MYRTFNFINMKTKISVLISFLLVASAAHAQYFIEENFSFSRSKGAYVITNSGEKKEGQFRSAAFNRYSIKTVGLLIGSEKTNFSAEDIKTFVAIPTAFMKFSSQMDRATDMTKMTDQNFEDVIKRDSIYFEQAHIPRKDEKRMVQLLNPGFDGKIKVYKDPFAKQTASIGVAGMKVAGGDDKSFLVVKEGMTEPMFVKKKTFEEQFVQLFGDCEKFMEYYKEHPNSIKIQNFADHIFFYDQWSE